MKIALAADHGGFELKQQLKTALLQQGHEVLDFGPEHYDKQDDYPDFGKPAAAAVSAGSAERAILMCNNGIGMSILANKHPGVRAAVAYSESSARDTRAHHDSNVLCLGGQEFPPERLLRFIDVWLNTPFEGGRHERRMAKINSLEQTPRKP